MLYFFIGKVYLSKNGMLYLTNDRLIQKEKWNAYLTELG